MSAPMTAEEATAAMGRTPPGVPPGLPMGFFSQYAPPPSEPPPQEPPPPPPLQPGGLVLGGLGPGTHVAADPRVSGQQQRPTVPPQPQAVGDGRNSRRTSSDAASAAAAAAAEAAAAAQSVQNSGDAEIMDLDRVKLIKDVFRACDVDGDGWLGESEFRKVANQFGFTGSDAKWASEYQVFCEEKKLDPAKGVSPSLFRQLMNDDIGLKSTNEALRKMLHDFQRLAPPVGAPPAPGSQQRAGQRRQEPREVAPPRFDANANRRRKESGDAWDTSGEGGGYPGSGPRQGEKTIERISQVRQDLIRSVFRACDLNDDDWLGASEFRAIASTLGGFQGSDELWNSEFAKLCAEKRTNPNKGVGPTLFMQLVNDEKSGLMATDEELRKLLTKLEKVKAKYVPPEPVDDEFYSKLKKTVNWYNKHGGLKEPIRFTQVHEELSKIPSRAMKILFDLDKVKEQEELKDPTGWIIAEARRRAKEMAAEKAGKGESRGEEGKKGEAQKGPAKATEVKGDQKWGPSDEKTWNRWENKPSDGKSPTEKAGTKPPEGQDDDEITSKMRRTANWYNKHGGLLAPIRFQEVLNDIRTNNTDPRVMVKILADLDQANAEAVLPDPTKWILEESRRRTADDKPHSSEPGVQKPVASKLGGLTSMPGRLGPGRLGPGSKSKSEVSVH
eukprot:TRINITY_DN725_c0_g1_i1.p1 TRINITY_DN725_c0_g1~~TRINITY_DN725_c0_g1_i1.p1  ORF type:complete len:717 (-),score=151.21 TRINITY_DN725_c0_g1_i1:41-2050(-)